MKWKFKKDGNDCDVKIVLEDGTENNFSYIELVRLLYEGERIDESVDYNGSFTDKEKDSITELIKEINEKVESFFDDSPYNTENTAVESFEGDSKNSSSIE